MCRLISVRFVVRNAAGSRKRQAVGFARMTIFTLDAIRLGIFSIHAEFVRDAVINGEKPIVCAAINRRCTKIGMKRARKNDAIQLV